MFRKLRLKLTFLNVFIVGLIMLFFVSGIYIMMTKNISRQSDQLMSLIASDVGGGSANKSHDRQRRWVGYFYVKVNTNSEITDVSPNIPISNDQLNSLITKTMTLPTSRGAIRLDDNLYRYLKVPQNNKQGSTLVFLNTLSENEILARLLATLIIIGLVGLTLVFFGSLFLAEKALVPIKAAWQKQREFIADASHELRTPLAVIQTNLELVMGNNEETIESQAKWLENIKAENTRMAKLVNDLLLIARTDSKQEPLEMQQFYIDKSVKEALKPLEPMASVRHINIESSIERDVLFYGDEARIKQLVVILIDNAIKYTSSGGKVTLKLAEINKNIELTVSDTGEGIDKEHLGKIFERFYRIDKARSRQSGGTGLGLSIAEWIVKEHNGAIDVTSSPGKGSTFAVALPRNK